MEDEDRFIREEVKESMRASVRKEVLEAEAELRTKGFALSRLQIIRRMLGNLPLALNYYERTKSIEGADDHEQRHVGVEIIAEILREMERNAQN